MSSMAEGGGEPLGLLLYRTLNPIHEAAPSDYPTQSSHLPDAICLSSLGFQHMVVGEKH